MLCSWRAAPAGRRPGPDRGDYDHRTGQQVPRGRPGDREAGSRFTGQAVPPPPRAAAACQAVSYWLGHIPAGLLLAILMYGTAPTF